MKLFFIALVLIAHHAVSAQDRIVKNALGGIDSGYKRPAHFSFLTNIPRDVAGFTRQSFGKENIPYVGLVVVSTVSLWVFDQQITDFIQQTAEHNNIKADEHFVPLIQVNINGNQTNIVKIPKNINTAFYNIGQGSSVMIMAGALLLKGKIKKDNRALQTASQLANAFLTLGAGTQLLKYATGRENPAVATREAGAWRPFPSWSSFQSNKPRYDAFPSGHVATFVSAITILAENYPEVKWIKPVGYGISVLCSLAMINNGVHWASDYPLAVALGYGYGKYISRKNKPVKRVDLSY